MKNRSFTLKTSVLCLALLILLSCSRRESTSITIACASNAQYAIEELCKEFESESGLKTILVIGSSGKLTAQIKEGAPYDVFISADMKYPDEIYKNGQGLIAPQVYAYGKLALISIDPKIIADIGLLESNSIQHIAVANAKTAPYGIAAERVLRHYGLYEKVKHKLVYGESISQTNQFISTGAAELGFTSVSSIQAFDQVALSSYTNFDDNSYPLIEQGAILIKNSNRKQELAKKFYLFLFSKKAEEILLKYGYELPNKQEE